MGFSGSRYNLLDFTDQERIVFSTSADGFFRSVDVPLLPGRFFKFHTPFLLRGPILVFSECLRSNLVHFQERIIPLGISSHVMPERFLRFVCSHAHLAFKGVSFKDKFVCRIYLILFPFLMRNLFNRDSDVRNTGIKFVVGFVDRPGLAVDVEPLCLFLASLDFRFYPFFKSHAKHPSPEEKRTRTGLNICRYFRIELFVFGRGFF